MSENERVLALARRALAGVGWRQIRAAVLLGLAVTAWNLLVYIDQIRFALRTMPLFHLAEALIGNEIRALCLMLAIVIADRAVDEGAPRRRAYVLAAAVGCFAGFLASEPFHWVWRTYVLPNPWPKQWPWANGATGNIFWPIVWLTGWLPMGSAVVFLHAHRRAARRMAQIMHVAELDRIRRSRIALESRLQAMQARVEPQFLLNTLAQVERLYKTDAQIAAQTLNDLIAYLRAAMPAMRDSSSTVAQEIALARAYLDIVRLRLGQRLSVHTSMPPEVGQVRMPPMMLLPLIDHAVVHGLERSTGSGTISIDASVAAGRLTLSIVDSGAGFVPESDGGGIEAIRERLDALYRGGATLDLRETRADGPATMAVLDLPLEPPESRG